MYQVGVDIGGTNIAMGLVDEALEVVQRESMPFEIKGGGERTAEIIHEGTLAMLKRQGAGLYDLDSVGVVVPGSIAEAFYGVPEELRQECRKRLPPELAAILRRWESALYNEKICGRI